MYGIRGRRRRKTSPEEWVQQRTAALVSVSAELDCDPEEEFELLEKIGSGASGVVFKAIRRLTGDIIAVKKVFVTEGNLSELTREIRVMRDLGGTYCVEYYGSFFKDDELWIAMEYFEAGSIGDILEGQGTEDKGLPEDHIYCIVKQLLPGLAHMHENNYAHRDIKSGNLLLNRSGLIKLCDFGITTKLSDGGTPLSEQVGSPYWMAPEALDGQGYTQSVDIWALGITLIEMTEYNHPFFQINPMGVMIHIVQEDPPKLTDKKRWSANFRDFVTTCLTKDPKKRPTAADLMEHRFISKNKGRDEQALMSLVSQYYKLVETAGSHAAMRGEVAMETTEGEAIVQFHLEDGTKRAILVHVDDTAMDVCQKVASSNGVEDPNFFALYSIPKENELRVASDEKPIELLASLPADRKYLIFREKPDDKTFTRLMELDALQPNAKICPAKTLTESYGGTVTEFLEILFAANLSLVGALTRISLGDEMRMARSFLEVFSVQRQVPRLLAKVCKAEASAIASKGQSHATLFRGNSIAGAILSQYLKQTCLNYFKKSLIRAFGIILNDETPIEVDPNRISERIPERVEALREKSFVLLKQRSLLVLEAIIGSINEIPESLRLICREMQLIVTHYFPGKSFVVPSAVLFARGFCPALVSPKGFNIMDRQLAPSSTRTLLLVSKVMQALSSGVKFGRKEQYLVEMNSFLEEHQPRVDEFFNNVIRIRPPSETTRTISGDDLLYKQMDPIAVHHLFTYSMENLMVLGQALKVLPPPPDEETGINSPLTRVRKKRPDSRRSLTV